MGSIENKLNKKTKNLPFRYQQFLVVVDPIGREVLKITQNDFRIDYYPVTNDAFGSRFVVYTMR